MRTTRSGHDARSVVRDRVHGRDALVTATRLGLKRLMVLGVRGLRTAERPPLLGRTCRGWSRWDCRCTAGVTRSIGMVGAHFVDREAPQHLRAGTQALVTFLANGPAVLAGKPPRGPTWWNRTGPRTSPTGQACGSYRSLGTSWRSSSSSLCSANRPDNPRGQGSEVRTQPLTILTSDP